MEPSNGPTKSIIRHAARADTWGMASQVEGTAGGWAVIVAARRATTIAPVLDDTPLTGGSPIAGHRPEYLPNTVPRLGLSLPIGIPTRAMLTSKRAPPSITAVTLAPSMDVSVRSCRCVVRSETPRNGVRRSEELRTCALSTSTRTLTLSSTAKTSRVSPIRDEAERTALHPNRCPYRT